MRVAVGCSFTAGTGVERTQAYPHLMGYDNWAKPGSDIEYSLWCAHRAVDEGATHILFQITSWDRISLALDSTHNFANNRPWTGDARAESFTLADYVKDQNHIKWLFEHHVMSNWRTENLAQRLHELQAYAQQHDCTVTFYDWFPRHNIPSHPLVAKLLTKPSVLDWLGDDYYVDDHYHINPQGHRLLAEKYFD